MQDAATGGAWGKVHGDLPVYFIATAYESLFPNKKLTSISENGASVQQLTLRWFRKKILVVAVFFKFNFKIIKVIFKKLFKISYF